MGGSEALIPGMPNIVFLWLGAAGWWLGTEVGGGGTLRLPAAAVAAGMLSGMVFRSGSGAGAGIEPELLRLRAAADGGGGADFFTVSDADNPSSDFDSSELT